MDQTVQSIQSVEQIERVGDSPIDGEAVLEALRQCYDPEIPVNVVDLGLIYGLRIEGDTVNVTMTLTAIGCPVAPEVMAEVQGRIKETAGVETCEVDLTFEPMWTPERMTEDARWELGI
jgi:metal-sulfur cluster biosynthetic enzyme